MTLNLTKRIALYAGSFDPMTNGHLDVLRAGLAIADTIIVAVGIHPGKKPLFDFTERKALIEAVVAAAGFGDRTQVVSFDSLVVEAAQAAGATLLLRGLRDGSDLDYEMQLAGMNGTMAPTLQTVFMPATPGVRFITATLVRQIAAMGGNIDAFVPPAVRDALAQKYANT
ncbi:MAG: pantetheine-phosphate adenylyltransferase [Ahrensia sp.]